MDKGSGSNSGRNDLARYKISRRLGIGGFGKVELAIHTLTGLKVAIKILDLRSMDSVGEEKVRTEINIMRQLFHPHVVRLYEVINTPSNVYVVMEYMNSGELYYYITEKGRLDEDEACHFFQQIISGVEYCHQHMVVHRDLKPENLLLDSEHNVKIADFGLGNIMRDGHFLKTSCGSPNYAAPELTQRLLYAGPEVDVWSCGVILYALLCGQLPFDDDSLPGLYAKIRSGAYPPANHVSEGGQDLISRMLVVDPVKRISIPEIRSHPWFREHLPLYIAVRLPNDSNKTEKVDINVLKTMVQMGFDVRDVIGSLQNHVQNEATVTYSMLLHTSSPGRMNQYIANLNNLNAQGLQEYMDHPRTYLRPISSAQNKWALGFKSQETLRETMLDVLRVFHSLNVKWKRIGLYNMKCLWLPPPSTFSISNIRSVDAVRFEIQLYKADGELFVLDLQQLSGPPFLFLELCAAFRALVVYPALGI